MTPRPWGVAALQSILDVPLMLGLRASMLVGVFVGLMELWVLHSPAAAWCVRARCRALVGARLRRPSGPAGVPRRGSRLRAQREDARGREQRHFVRALCSGMLLVLPFRWPRRPQCLPGRQRSYELAHGRRGSRSTRRGAGRRALQADVQRLPELARAGSLRPQLPWRRPWFASSWRLACLAGVAAGCWVLLRAPAWASGMAAGGVERHITGTFSFRVMHYKAICGSLTMDLVMGICFFFIFGCCAGTETAITTLWPWKVRELAQREQEGAERTGKRRLGMWTALRSDIQRFMQTILIGATLSGVFSTAFVTEICAQLFGGSGLAIATMSVSVLQLIFCEIVPKGVAVCNAYEFASITLPWYFWISGIVYPIGRRLNRGVESVLRLVGISIDASKTPYVSEDELDLMLQSAMRTGILETEEGKMISSVRELDTKRVSDIMVPLVEMICIDTSESISSLHEAFSQTQYSRLPVYKDRFDNVVGIVSMKTLLRKVRHLDVSDWEQVSVDEVVDRPFFVPETMTVLNLLQYLKERPIAVCVDEYGGTTGLVTLQDVLEEIVGEIYDPDVERHRGPKRRKNDQIEVLEDGTFVMTASADIDDVSISLGVELPEGNYNSIGGFMADIADRIPRQGEVVVVRTSGMTVSFEAIEVDERKVVRIQAETVMVEEDGSNKNPHAREDAEADEDRLERVIEVSLKPLEDAEDAQDVEEGDTLGKSASSTEAEDSLPQKPETLKSEKQPEAPVLRRVEEKQRGTDGLETTRASTSSRSSPQAANSPSRQLPWSGLGVVLGGIMGGALGATVGEAYGLGSGGLMIGAILGSISGDTLYTCYVPW